MSRAYLSLPLVLFGDTFQYPLPYSVTYYLNGPLVQIYCFYLSPFSNCHYMCSNFTAIFSKWFSLLKRRPWRNSWNVVIIIFLIFFFFGVPHLATCIFKFLFLNYWMNQDWVYRQPLLSAGLLFAVSTISSLWFVFRICYPRIFPSVIRGFCTF